MHDAISRVSMMKLPCAHATLGVASAAATVTVLAAISRYRRVPL
jgi:hypothetical protein